MWKCNDGFLAYSESEALAYEVKVAIDMLSKTYAGKIKINQFGQVDVEAAQSITREIIADLSGRVEAVREAVEALRLMEMEWRT
jgi:hypothetical protein